MRAQLLSLLLLPLIACFAGCVSEQTEAEILAEEEELTTLAEAELLAEEELALAEAELLAEEEELATLATSEPLAASPDEVTPLATYCCQVWIIDEPQALLCDTMSGWKPWAQARCTALAASIPFSYPKLVSGSCSNYRPGICPN